MVVSCMQGQLDPSLAMRLYDANHGGVVVLQHHFALLESRYWLDKDLPRRLCTHLVASMQTNRETYLVSQDVVA